MKKIFLLSFLLTSCNSLSEIKAVDNYETDLNDFEYIEKYAIRYANALNNKENEILFRNSLANNCSDICLKSGIKNATDFIERVLKESELKSIKFEAQNIRYFDNDQQVQVLLHGINNKQNKIIALLFNLRLIGDVWKLDLSNFVKD